MGGSGRGTIAKRRPFLPDWLGIIIFMILPMVALVILAIVVME